MKFACLFSGIGALTHGLKVAGHEPVLLVELEESARHCLSVNFPGVELHGNIFEVHDLPEGTELVTAGFPCSDVSLNNQTGRKGLEGRRTGLFGHVVRLLRNNRVPWVLLENVKGLLSSIKVNEDAGEEKGPAPIEEVYRQLEILGYSVASRVVSLPGFGLPHGRDRVLILASLHGDPRDVLLGQQGRGCSENNSRVCSGECELYCGGPCYSCFVRKRDASMAPIVEPQYDCRHDDANRRSENCTLTSPLFPPNSSPPPAASGASPWGTSSSSSRLQSNARPLGISIDTAEKRSAPRLDLVPTLTTANPSRICVLQIPASEEEQQQDLPKPRYLTVKDVEALFGLPSGWTAPVSELYDQPGTLASRSMKRPIAALEAEDNCRRERMKLLGGSVPVPFAKWIGTNLALPNLHQHKFLGDKDTVQEIPEGTTSWPGAAFSMASSSKRYAVRHIGIFPVPCRYIPLLELINPSGIVVPPKILRDWEGRMHNVDWKLDADLSRALERVKKYCSCKDDSSNIPDAVGEVGFIARPDSSLWPAVFFDPLVDEDCAYVPASILRMYKANHSAPQDARVALLLGYQQGEWSLTSAKEFLPFGPFRAIVEEARENDPHICAFAHDGSLFSAAMSCAATRYQVQHIAAAAPSSGMATVTREMDVSGSSRDETLTSYIIPGYSTSPTTQAVDIESCQRCNLCRRRSLRSDAISTQCMMMVARDIAKQGHNGASLTCMKEQAIGVRVDVFWAREGSWYSGTIESFFPENVSHKLVYDDGDVEVLCLLNHHVRRTS